MPTKMILRFFQWMLVSRSDQVNRLTAAQLSDTMADDPKAQLRYFGHYINVNENREFIKAWEV